jgi:hypothetical protein
LSMAVSDYSAVLPGDVALKVPPVTIKEYNGIMVVRDDLMPGGTKARALPVLMPGSCREYVYASPVCGYAQVALAHVARRTGNRATIFCAQRSKRHRLTLVAMELGASVIEIPVGYMSVVASRARAYCEEHGSVLLPFGLNTQPFIDALASVAASLPVTPKEVWCVSGSGVLARSLQQAWPDAAFHAVRVGAHPEAGKAIVHQASERFDQDARYPPPFPSCANYDAKAWLFVRAIAKPGALFWNVAA